MHMNMNICRVKSVKAVKAVQCTMYVLCRQHQGSADKSPAHPRADNRSVRLSFFFFFFPSIFLLCGKKKDIPQLWSLHWLILGLYWTIIYHLHISIQLRNHPNNRQNVAKAICYLQRCKNPNLLTMTISRCLCQKKKKKTMLKTSKTHMNSQPPQNKNRRLSYRSPQL